MENYKVCILTAGKGSRLNEYTKCFNKALLRVGDKPAISYNIECFPEDVEFVVVLGYLGDIVKQFLTMAYPNRYFTFVETDKYSQPGAGPGYALMQCKRHLQCPFYYISCDSIINWEEIDVFAENAGDAIGNWSTYDYIDVKESYKYCTIETEDDYISTFFDKQRNGTNKVYVGISYINDYKELWKKLEKEEETSDGEIQVVSSILSLNETRAIKCDWLDVGCKDGLKQARKKFPETIKRLDKLDEDIYIVDGKVIKYFFDTQINNDRLARISRLMDLVPTIEDYSSNYYKYKYIQGNDLSNYSKIDKIFPDLLDFVKNRLWKKIELSDVAQEDFRHACNMFYQQKTIDRLEKLAREKSFIFDNKKKLNLEIINGTAIPDFDKILNRINWSFFSDGLPSNFHGDFVFSNILFDHINKEFTLIDWRQDFGGLIDYGDVYYDLAKLNTEMLVPRRSVNNEKYYIDKTCDGVKVFIETPVEIERCKDQFEQFIKKERLDLGKIKTLTGIILLNMSPLHEYPLDEWLYYYGKHYLWSQLNE